MRRTMRVITIGTVLVVLGLATAWYLRPKQETAAMLRTVSLQRGNLLVTISATGTVEPEEVVDVGAQVAGQINAFGKDRNGKSIDYGSEVEVGTVLAKIDDSLYAADVETARAQLQQAHANLLNANADVLQIQAKLVQAQQDWDRAQKLGPSEALAPSAYDQYKANYKVAKANVAVGHAAVAQAKAAVAQAQANLDRAQHNEDYCTIKSPVKGVIIDRRVNIGQTVVSSLNAPSLFLIAKDLKRIQVWVSVNEADIGNIHPGMSVTFTVDTFPGRVFKGQVGQVRLNAMMTQNVVTYTVVVNTDNSDGKLLPYLTANVQFITGQRQNVLLVPNAALRWSPQSNQIATQFRQVSDTTGGPPSHEAVATHTPTGPSEAQRTLWVAQGNYVRPVKVGTGLTDGTLTEVDGADVSAGMQVVVGDQSSPVSSEAGGGPSPFTPHLHRTRSQAAPGGAPAGRRPGGRP
jgi:HlyD family secretion protein